MVAPVTCLNTRGLTLGFHSNSLWYLRILSENSAVWLLALATSFTSRHVAMPTEQRRSTKKTKRWILDKQFDGHPTRANFRMTEEELPVLQDGGTPNFHFFTHVNDLTSCGKISIKTYNKVEFCHSHLAPVLYCSPNTYYLRGAGRVKVMSLLFTTISSAEHALVSKPDVTLLYSDELGSIFAEKRPRQIMLNQTLKLFAFYRSSLS